MQAQGSQLLYNIFLDAVHTVPWGNGSAGSVAVSSTVTGGGVTISRAIPVFAEISARQQAVSGTYSDILVATVSF